MPSGDLTARLEQLSNQAQRAHGEFTGQRERAEQLAAAAKGTSVGSEAWALASVALAGLESARSQAMIALADLDTLYAAEKVSGRETAVIAAARSRVTEWIGEEDRVLARLRQGIAG